MSATKFVPPTLEEIQNFKGKFPKQLWYLALVEMWERFTFYGMRALLVLYICHLVLSGNHTPAEADYIEAKKTEYATKFNETLDESHPKYYLETSDLKVKSDIEAKSNIQYGLILAFIYSMAFVGGLFADKLFGARHSVFWGGILMAIGTFIMAVPGALWFYVGISVLIVGNGFFKPNISTMVGSLYRQDDSRRDSGFSIFYMAINLGSLLSGATIAYIGTSISWSLGFALSGVCMLLGLALFMYTKRYLGPIGDAPNPKKLKEKKFGISKNILYHLGSLAFIPFFLVMVYYPIEIDLTFLLGQATDAAGNLTPNIVEFRDIFMIGIGIAILFYLGYLVVKSSKEESGKLLVAIILILFSVLFWSFYEQGGGSLSFFSLGHVDGHGLNMTQVNNMVNPLWVITLAPLMSVLWIALSKRKKEPNTVVKFGMGFLLLGAGFLIFFASKFFAIDPSAMTPLTMFIAAYGVITLGELCLSPIGLSMITTLTPARLHGVMMGTWFLASAYGQYGAGIIGSVLAKVETANPTAWDKLESYTSGYQSVGYIALAAGAILILASPFLVKIMKKDKTAS